MGGSTTRKPRSASVSVAYELENIVAQHNWHIREFVKTPLTFERHKVESLVKSLSSVERLPALNHEEIMSVVFGLKLTKEERIASMPRLLHLAYNV